MRRGRRSLRRRWRQLWAGANVAENPAERTLVKNEYLEVVARRR